MGKEMSKEDILNNELTLNMIATDLMNIKQALINSGNVFIETIREERKYQYVQGEDYTFIEVQKKTGFIKIAFDHNGKMNSIDFYING